MKVLFKKYPVDIFLCMIISLILIPLSFFKIESLLRVILGLPFIVFIPGYLLIFVLFPTKKTDDGIDFTERIALSFGVSLAVSALLVFSLNYRSGAYSLESVFLPIFAYVCFMVILSSYRWLKTPSDERFIISFSFSFLKFKNKFIYRSKLDRIFLIVLIVLSVVVVILFVFIVSTPISEEKFTDFYILGSDRDLVSFPSNLSLDEKANVIIGIVNHEHETVSYTVEIWLINQTIKVNSSTLLNEIKIHNAWFMDKINITLDHQPSNNYDLYIPQWEHNYTFNISKKGEEFRLEFLLFKGPTKSYNPSLDYSDEIEENINLSYEDLYLDINII